jgi:hypothetical protein
MRAYRLVKLATLVGLMSCLQGCDEPEATAPVQKAPLAPAKLSEPEPKVVVPSTPSFTVDAEGFNVGGDRAPFAGEQSASKLTALVQSHVAHIAQKQVELVVEREAPSTAVGTVIARLYDAGASSVTVKTSSRAEYPQQLVFAKIPTAGEVPACSLVATILEDRATAVWRLNGGTASSRRKGLGGPDLTMTGETIARLAKTCGESKTIFISPGQDGSWGLTYDLAASTTRVEDTSFDAIVLLEQSATAGRPVSL